MAVLKLIALDEVDLQVLSTHMQDAILRVVDMAWEPGSHRFLALMNRFDWQQAGDKTIVNTAKKPYERHRCALRFDKVESVQLKNITFGRSDTVLELLALRFEPTEPPAGRIELIFAGNSSIRLNVECIEAQLSDLGQPWGVRSRPEHEG